MTPELGGHPPDARKAALGALSATGLPAGPVVTRCGHGERATTAASVLERAGHRDLALLVGGPDDWAHGSGRSLRVGA